jgi:hypothetical protein
MSNLDEADREHYAREILNNPLFLEIMEKLERDAVNKAVNAIPTDTLAQQAALAEIRAARSFRRQCEFEIRNKPVPKAAPA